MKNIRKIIKIEWNLKKNLCTLKSCEIKLNCILNWTSIKRNQAQFFFLNTPPRFTLQEKLASNQNEHNFSANQPNTLPDSQKKTLKQIFSSEPFFPPKNTKFPCHDVLYIHFSEQKSTFWFFSGFLYWLFGPFYENSCGKTTGGQSRGNPIVGAIDEMFTALTFTIQRWIQF